MIHQTPTDAQDVSLDNGNGLKHQEMQYAPTTGLSTAEMEPDDVLSYVGTLTNPDDWFHSDVLDAIALVYPRPMPGETEPQPEENDIVWIKLKHRFTRIKGNVRLLCEAMDRHIDVLWALYEALQPKDKDYDADGFISATALLAKEFAPIQWIIPELLPAGCTLLTGAEKSGKSLMAMNLAVATAAGGVALGHTPVEKGSVLYMALEDGERRAKKRLEDQVAKLPGGCDISKLTMAIDPPDPIGHGFERKLVRWLDRTPDAKLVILDVLECVRPRQRAKNASIYSEDYWLIKPIQQIANKYNIALVIVHHTNKGTHDDWRNSVSGSRGLGGAVDAHWSLKRLPGDKGGVLRVMGRDMAEDAEYGLAFQDGFWTLQGQASEWCLNEDQQNILEVLREKGECMSPSALSRELGIKGSTMRSHLRRMLAKGLVLTVAPGQYIPCTQAPPPVPAMAEASLRVMSDARNGATVQRPATLATEEVAGLVSMQTPGTHLYVVPPVVPQAEVAPEAPMMFRESDSMTVNPDIVFHLGDQAISEDAGVAPVAPLQPNDELPVEKYPDDGYAGDQDLEFTLDPEEGSDLNEPW